MPGLRLGKIGIYKPRYTAPTQSAIHSLGFLGHPRNWLCTTSVSAHMKANNGLLSVREIGL